MVNKQSIITIGPMIDMKLIMHLIIKNIHTTMTKSLFFILILFPALVWATDHTAKHYQAERLSGATPEIDGSLDDPAWQQGEWSGDFIQFEPYNGRKASQETAFKILYDDDYIYVAIRCYDSAPDSIVERLTRRDRREGDLVAIGFDSYHDQRTAFAFGVNAAGVKFDFMITNDGQNEDMSWDPNWWVSTGTDDQGWVAEMRIPFSQLRFDGNGENIWGVQVLREIHRYGETSFWSHIPSDAPGLVHRFGTLGGMNGIEPRRVFDVTPYVVSSADRSPAVEGNPFQDGSDHQYKLGMDAKIGLSSNLTMDVTINPDFGQVEADPSQVNLTAYETFFAEKRPFFIEGRNISSFNIGMGDGDNGNDNLFYSRRIGRRPQGNISVENDAYVDTPGFTDILGAAKMTGRTESGFSVAIIDAVTAEEQAAIDLSGERSLKTVEPLTNFFVGRLQKEFNDGNSMIGGMFTSVHRRNNDNLAEQMHGAAYTGGLDYSRYFSDRTWNLSVNAAMSHVAGTEAAMLRTQRSSTRYFQRPDATHLDLDSTRTSLTGIGGKIQLAKTGGGHWNIFSVITWKSPEFEINDIGYMRETDQIVQINAVNYREWEPKSFYRSYNIGLNQYSLWDFAGKNLMKGWNINGFIRYRNYWTTGMGINYNHDIVSTDLLRGGPAFRMPDRTNSWFRAGTDNRKDFVASINGNLSRGGEGYQQSSRIGAGLTYRPLDNLNMSLSPSYLKNSQSLQYVSRTSHGERPRYILGHIKQEVLSFSFRVNYTILPDLTIQYWGQPFVAAGHYSDFKYVTDPMADSFNDRYALLGPDQITLTDGLYQVDENLDGTVDYQFSKPDFRVQEFLSNLVLRWEYNPGSSIHLVWSQNRSGFAQNGNLQYGNSMDDLFSVEAHNTFLIKVTYRIGVR